MEELWIGALLGVIAALISGVDKWKKSSEAGSKKNNTIAILTGLVALGGIILTVVSGTRANMERINSNRIAAREKRNNESLNRQLSQKQDSLLMYSDENRKAQEKLLVYSENQKGSSDTLLNYSRRLNQAQGKVTELPDELFKNYKGSAFPLITFESGSAKKEFIATLVNVDKKYSLYNIDVTLTDYDQIKECKPDIRQDGPYYPYDCLMKGSFIFSMQEMGKGAAVRIGYTKTVSASERAFKLFEAKIKTRNGTFIQQILFYPFNGVGECPQYVKLWYDDNESLKMIFEQNTIANYTITKEEWDKLFLPVRKKIYMEQSPSAQ